MTLGNSPQPLTRRQLRELARDQEPASAEDATAEDATAAAPAGTESAGDTSIHSRHTSPPAQAAETAGPVAAPRVPAPAPLPVPSVPVPSVPVPSVPVPADTHTLTRREMRALQAAVAASTADVSADHADEASVPVSAQEGVVVDTPSSGLHPPIGHWSVDREDDDHIQEIGRRDDDTFDDLVARGIGAGGMPTTTNALILPAIPRQGTGGPITSTGEIMITGSIDLPRSLGATGQLPNLFDSSEMDKMLDQLDEGGHHNDVAPVSASRAVSTHTSTRGVMTPPRKRGASLPTVLAITAAVLAIGVLSLFVIGYAFNIY